MTSPTQLCPNCGAILEYVKPVRFDEKEMKPVGSDRFTLKLASDIYQCPQHGLWRIYISGAVEPYQA